MYVHLPCKCTCTCIIHIATICVTGLLETNGPSTWTTETRRKNMLLRMISDPKCYSPRILKSLSHKEKRHKSDDTQKAEKKAGATADEPMKPSV